MPNQNCCIATDINITTSGVVALSGVSSCILPILRVFINDLTGATYSDARLEQTIIGAAFLVNGDLAGSTCINVPDLDFCDQSFSANITDSQYAQYLLLVLLRAACLIDQAEMKSKVNSSGLRAVCGPASLSVNSSTGDLAILFDRGNCANYQKTKKNFLFLGPMRAAKGAGQIIHQLCCYTDQYYKGCKPDYPYNCYKECE